MSKPVFDTAWRDSLPTLKDVIDTHGLYARKALGQNFIIDTGITDRIAGFAGDLNGARVIEIGAGPGGLTRSLLSTNADHVTAIEFDPRAVAALKALIPIWPDRFNLLEKDALKIGWETFLAEHPKNVIVANLPYNISTVLLVNWLGVLARTQNRIDRMVLMFQKEVAERLVARPSTPDYGRLSVLTQWLTIPDIVMVLPPGAFVPAPKIYSAVVRFDPRRRDGIPVEWAFMDSLLTKGFAHRRKMLRSNLKEFLWALAEEGVDSASRAEELSTDIWINLACRIARREKEK